MWKSSLPRAAAPPPVGTRSTASVTFLLSRVLSFNLGRRGNRPYLTRRSCGCREVRELGAIQIWDANSIEHRRRRQDGVRGSCLRLGGWRPGIRSGRLRPRGCRLQLRSGWLRDCGTRPRLCGCRVRHRGIRPGPGGSGDFRNCSKARRGGWVPSFCSCSSRLCRAKLPASGMNFFLHSPLREGVSSNNRQS